MKKIIAWMLVVTLSVVLWGCAAAPEDAESPVTELSEASEPQLVEVYSDENCLIRFCKVETAEGEVTAEFCVTNLTERTLTFQSDCVSLNGESFSSIIMSDEVAPNSEGTISMSILDANPTEIDPDGIGHIGGSFTIIDFDDENFHDGSISYRVRYQNVTVPCQKAFEWSREPGTPVYEDDKVSISFLYADREDEDTRVWFRVENKTDQVITIQAASLGLNDVSAGDTIGSEAVAPGAVGNIRIRCDIDTDLSAVTQITGTLRVIAFDVEDFHDGRQSYEVTFSQGEEPVSVGAVETAYREMLELTGVDLSKTAAGNYRYNGLTVFEDDYMVLGGELVVNQGAMYGCAANFLELYCENDGMLYGNGPEALYEMLLGTQKPASWAEFEPTARALYTFIFPGATEGDILKAFEPLSQVEGSFDYDARAYDFTVSDLTEAAAELGISERMLGYVLAKLSEYAPEIAFDGNSLHFSLEVMTFG